MWARGLFTSGENSWLHFTRVEANSFAEIMTGQEILSQAQDDVGDTIVFQILMN